MTECTGERVVIIRPSFKKFCGNDACRAAAFNHLLYWIAKKVKGEPAEKIKKGEVSWYGSGEEITSELDDSWSVNKVRQEVKNLVSDGLIGQRRNPQNGWFQTRHYFFGEEQGKALKAKCEELGIILAHMALPAEIVHLLNLVNAFTKCGESNCQICEMHLPNMVATITKNGKSKTQNTTQVSTQVSNSEKKDTSNEKSETSNTDTSSLSPSSENTSSENPDLTTGEATNRPKENKGATLHMLPIFGSQDEEKDNASNEQASGASYSQENAPSDPSEGDKDTTDEAPDGPPQLPPANARLSAELVVRLIECKKERAYSDDTHKQELNVARKLLRLKHEGAKLTRDDIQYALDDMFSWPFWEEHTNVKPMLRTLLKDDKILTMLDDRKKKPNKKPANGQSVASNLKQTTDTASAMAEAQARDERNKANIEKMRQRKATQDAKKKGA